MRRQPPRASPSCTRVFGPIDAMTRALRSALARTTTQFRATELTHTTRVARGLTGPFATVGAGAFATALLGAFATAFGGAFAGGVTRGAGLVDGVRAGVRAAVRSGARASVCVVERAGRDFADTTPFSPDAIDVRARGRSRVVTGSRTGRASGSGGGAVCATGSTTTGAESTAVEGDCAIESEIAATTDATDWIVESDATTVVESNVATESRGMLSPVAAAASDESSDPADVSGLSTAASRACETSTGGSS